jgi:hypothetical protein
MTDLGCGPYGLRDVYWSMERRRLTVPTDPAAVALMRAEIDSRADEDDDAGFYPLDEYERDELAEMAAATRGSPCPHLMRRVDTETGPTP